MPENQSRLKMRDQQALLYNCQDVKNDAEQSLLAAWVQQQQTVSAFILGIVLWYDWAMWISFVFHKISYCFWSFRSDVNSRNSSIVFSNFVALVELSSFARLMARLLLLLAGFGSQKILLAMSSFEKKLRRFTMIMTVCIIRSARYYPAQYFWEKVKYCAMTGSVEPK